MSLLENVFSIPIQLLENVFGVSLPPTPEERYRFLDQLLRQNQEENQEENQGQNQEENQGQ